MMNILFSKVVLAVSFMLCNLLTVSATADIIINDLEKVAKDVSSTNKSIVRKNLERDVFSNRLGLQYSGERISAHFFSQSSSTDNKARVGVPKLTSPKKRIFALAASVAKENRPADMEVAMNMNQGGASSVKESAGVKDDPFWDFVSFSVSISSSTSTSTSTSLSAAMSASGFLSSIGPPPTPKPSSAPSFLPTPGPGEPTLVPTQAPTAAPTQVPSFLPTPGPGEPTLVPTQAPTAAPTQVPSFLPTDAPTQAPTAAPTQVPSFLPTPGPREPTLVPTQAPTAAPTQVPSFLPTPGPGEPTLVPTQAPTTAPTQIPSFLPTDAPTQAPTVLPGSPTFKPTRSPTRAPSKKPTRMPTAAPSKKPTRRPTYAPSKQTSPIVEFVSNITMGGLTEPELDDAAQKSIVNATAVSMGLTATSVTYLGATFTEESRRLTGTDASADAHTAGLSSYAFGKEQLETTYSANAITKTAVPLDTTGFTNATVLYDQLTSSLTEAVEDGSFTQSLTAAAQAFDAPVVANADATGIANSPLILLVPGDNDGGSSSNSEKSDDDEQDVLTGGEIAGIVIGVLVAVALAAFAVWYVLFRDASNKEAFTADKHLEIDL